MTAYTSSKFFGAPTSGRFVVGDTYADAAGVEYECVEGGQPGRWVQGGVGVSPAEIKRVADVGSRLVAAGSTLTVTQAAHDGKTIVLGTAAGCTITLPAATGSGMRLRFVVSVKPTSNQHRINVVGDDAFVGSVNILDLDGAAQGAYGAGTDADRFDMNGGTKGGQVGDVVTLEDILADRWHINGMLQVPTGSNPATPFATGQVS